MQNKNILLSEYKLSQQLMLKNRIVMAPMTRRRALADHTPSEVMIEYYSRRADAGLIVTEGTLINEDAIGYGNVPGIYTDEHIGAWSKITAATHANNGSLFIQLWHCGRISHTDFHFGKAPISASKTTANIVLGSTKLSCSTSKEASFSEIQELISSYVKAAENAMTAGFDGIEIHGANGYLIDQFLHYCTNNRRDEYGQTPENMARFALEVIRACGERIGYKKVGIRLSPGGHMNDIMTDARDGLVFSYLLSQLNDLDIAYVHTGNFDDFTTYPELGHKTMTDFIRSNYGGTVIASGSYNVESAAMNIQQHKSNLVALGRLFIANPDLIFLLKNNGRLNSYNAEMLHADLY